MIFHKYLYQFRVYQFTVPDKTLIIHFLLFCYCSLYFFKIQMQYLEHHFSSTHFPFSTRTSVLKILQLICNILGIYIFCPCKIVKLFFFFFFENLSLLRLHNEEGNQALLHSSILVTWPAHLNLIDVMILTKIFNDDHFISGVD